MEVVIIKSTKKCDARIDGTKTVSFGEKGASDFTKHKDTDRKDRYIDRHEAREDWIKSGAKAADSYSKRVLWNKPTLKTNIDDTKKKFKSLSVNMK